MTGGHAHGHAVWRARILARSPRMYNARMYNASAGAVRRRATVRHHQRFLSCNTPRKRSGSSVMMASTPSSIRRRISSASSIVQTCTCKPRVWAASIASASCGHPMMPDRDLRTLVERPGRYTQARQPRPQHFAGPIEVQSAGPGGGCGSGVCRRTTRRPRSTAHSATTLPWARRHCRVWGPVEFGVERFETSSSGYGLGASISASRTAAYSISATPLHIGHAINVVMKNR